jgi:hypothetical protein
MVALCAAIMVSTITSVSAQPDESVFLKQYQQYAGIYAKDCGPISLARYQPPSKNGYQYGALDLDGDWIPVDPNIVKVGVIRNPDGTPSELVHVCYEPDELYQVHAYGTPPPQFAVFLPPKYQGQ